MKVEQCQWSVAGGWDPLPRSCGLGASAQLVLLFGDAKLASTRLSLLVGCNARRAVLKQRVEEEVEAVRDVLGDQTVLTGFYSHGEIGPLETGGPPELHNETMCITSLAED